ncbi:MAG: hypothetical protein HYY01_07360 [Chloroflexi bacterium]|nr:hypothetical protein [Chloroflexota bacterium]
MPNEHVSNQELQKARTPSELWDWLIQKVDQICSTPEGIQDFRLQKGLIKQLVEEVRPLAIFGEHKFGDTNQVHLQPVVGNQNYDAVVTDSRTEPHSTSYLEVTQAHEGENDYWRRCELLRKGFVFPYATVIKQGTNKNRTVSVPPEATSVEERVKTELRRILIAAQKKEHRDYPANTSLVIFFDDTPPFQKVIDHERLDVFVRGEILNLDLRFAKLYLVGEAKGVFREYSTYEGSRSIAGS